jgi:DNA helicase IV
MGQDSDVRVFDVQHIKGLEFEAVFFIGIDRLAKLHPQLFDKYLYVGTTRAATYLGFTCDKVLPPAISSLRPLFVSDWKT